MDVLLFLSSAFSAVTGLKIHPPASMAGDGTCSLCGKVHSGGVKSKTNSLPPADAASPPAVCYGKPYPRPGVEHVGVTDLVYLTYGMMQPSRASADHDDADSVSQLTVQMLKQKARVTVEVPSNSTVQELRKMAADKMKLAPADQLMLIFNNNQLGDDQDIKHLGLTRESLIIGKKCVRGEEMGKFELDPSSLDPKYDYDLTNVSKPLLGQPFMRGQFQYERPYGWMRTALKVVNEYEDNAWLGPNGIRAETTPSEWPVSYHGTSKPNLRGIVQDGFKVGPRARFGPAIYSSPSLEKVDQYYASTFTHQGKTYSLALQNRVNPEHLTVYDPEMTGIAGFPYWLSPQQDPDHGIYHVRPYGILTREAGAGSWSDYFLSFFD